MSKKECIAMLLAGGQGSRLGALTQKIAKPAVSFGGKFRIIDFSLSNCSNSGIDTVGVLTQYRPYLLHAYVGSGEAWDLDSRDGGVSILPPYETQTGGAWYAGTADAITQNLDYIKANDPKYVLILSGDHLYRMDYRKMLKTHIENNADLTVSVMPVPWEEASRFGILTTDPEDGRITKFTEKPDKPRFEPRVHGHLYLHLAEAPLLSAGRRGRPHLRQRFRQEHHPRYAGRRRGHVRLSVRGLLEGCGHPGLPVGRQYGHAVPGVGAEPAGQEMAHLLPDPVLPTGVSGPPRRRGNSAVAKGCGILGEVKNSVLSYNTQVGQGASVSYSVVMPGAVIEEGAVVQYAIIGERCRVGRGAQVGAPPETAQDPAEWGIAVLGPDTVIAPGEVVPAKALLDRHHGEVEA